MKYKLNFFKKLRLFDYFLIFSFLFISLGFLAFFFRKSQFSLVKVKVTEKNILYAHTNSPIWFTYLFEKGMKEKDGLGRVNAEIVDVYYYDSEISKKAVYLTLRLKTVFNQRKGEYKYKGTSLNVGEGLRINLEKMLVEGLVVEVEGLNNTYEETYFQVEAQLQDDNEAFSETTGVDAFITNAIEVGDMVRDSKGEVIVEVLDKEVRPAQKNVFDDRANVYLREDPRKKDMFLTLKIKVKKIHGELFFLDDIPVKVNNTLPLHFEKISIWPVITQISLE